MQKREAWDNLVIQRLMVGARIPGLDWRDGAAAFCSAGLLAAFVLLPGAGDPTLPDLAPLPPQERKVEFFDFLAPIVTQINRQVLLSRERLLEIVGRTQEGRPLRWRDRRYLRNLAERYDVAMDDGGPEAVLQVLDRRVDIVPESLALVQAAKESGWGTSRFAREGNNLFGQRCYEPGCGIRPRDAAPDGRFGLARYESVYASVRDYVLNLNTHPEYFDFRSLRQSLRRQNEPLSGIALADGLGSYSERGAAYVTEIKALIRQNELEAP